MKFLSLIAVVAANLVAAQNFFITMPTAGTIYHAREKAAFQWNVNAWQPVIASTIRIDLMRGDENNAETVMTIVSDLPGDATSYTWTVPGNLRPSEDYFLKQRAISAAGAESINYSTRFSIIGGSANDASGSTPFEVVVFATASVIAGLLA